MIKVCFIGFSNFQAHLQFYLITLSEISYQNINQSTKIYLSPKSLLLLKSISHFLVFFHSSLILLSIIDQNCVLLYPD